MTGPESKLIQAWTRVRGDKGSASRSACSNKPVHYLWLPLFWNDCSGIPSWDLPFAGGSSLLCEMMALWEGRAQKKLVNLNPDTLSSAFFYQSTLSNEAAWILFLNQQGLPDRIDSLELSQRGFPMTTSFSFCRWKSCPTLWYSGFPKGSVTQFQAGFSIPSSDPWCSTAETRPQGTGAGHRLNEQENNRAQNSKVYPGTKHQVWFKSLFLQTAWVKDQAFCMLQTPSGTARWFSGAVGNAWVLTLKQILSGLCYPESFRQDEWEQIGKGEIRQE